MAIPHNSCACVHFPFCLLVQFIMSTMIYLSRGSSVDLCEHPWKLIVYKIIIHKLPYCSFTSISQWLVQLVQAVTMGRWGLTLGVMPDMVVRSKVTEVCLGLLRQAHLPLHGNRPQQGSEVDSCANPMMIGPVHVQDRDQGTVNPPPCHRNGGDAHCGLSA